MARKSLSPIYSLFSGYFLLIGIVLTFYGFGFYSDSIYFDWGPPIIFFSHKITSPLIFYLLLSMIFIHQLITNWIYEVVTPWIINTVQNPRNNTLEYRKSTCLVIINFNSLYNQVHTAFIIGGITSQASFLVPLILADVIALTYINTQYLKHKITPAINITDENDEPVIEIA